VLGWGEKWTNNGKERRCGLKNKPSLALRTDCPHKRRAEAVEG
jgi:hypothetical protein